MKIYVVEGQTGEYSDHRDWPVRAFLSEKKAQKLVLDAQARANEIYVNNSNSSPSWNDLEKPENKNQYDPDMDMDYVGTHYLYYPIELDTEE